MIDLRAEHRSAVATLTDEDRGVLADLGISPASLSRFRLCGIARVRVRRSRLYEPDENGNVALITPVRVECPASPESRRPLIYTQWGPIVDLVAWHPYAPERWALRVGSAEWLGCIEPQYMDPDPVPIHRTVLDWLRAGRVGLVPLAFEHAELYRLLTVCRRIRAADEEHARELRRALSHPWPQPDVEVADALAA